MQALNTAITQRLRKAVVAAAIAVVIAVLAQTAPAPAQAAEVEGIGIDDAVEVDGVRLELNGAGLRTVYIFKAYIAALYVPQRSRSPEVLLEQKGPRRLSLTMLADLSAQWFTRRFSIAIRDNHRKSELEQIGPRVERLLETMLTLGQMRKGERIDIDFIGGATRVSVDGHALGPAIPGEDLFTAVLRIFVGEHPLDAGLKQAMLGR